VTGCEKKAKKARCAGETLRGKGPNEFVPGGGRGSGVGPGQQSSQRDRRGPGWGEEFSGILDSLVARAQQASKNTCGKERGEGPANHVGAVKRTEKNKGGGKLF